MCFNFIFEGKFFILLFVLFLFEDIYFDRCVNIEKNEINKWNYVDNL